MSSKAILITTLLGITLASCTSENLELHTSEPVIVYSQPARPEVSGNQKLGTLPENITLPVKQEVLLKDMAAYEVEYAQNETVLRGFVLLGSNGPVIRKSGSN